MDPTEAAVQFIASVSTAVQGQKPDASEYEIIGVIYLILNQTITRLQNEQLPESREGQSTEGALGEPEQVQGAGEPRGISDSSQGVRSEQGSLTKSGKKKRRSKKTS